MLGLWATNTHELNFFLWAGFSLWNLVFPSARWVELPKLSGFLVYKSSIGLWHKFHYTHPYASGHTPSRTLPATMGTFQWVPSWLESLKKLHAKVHVSSRVAPVLQYTQHWSCFGVLFCCVPPLPSSQVQFFLLLWCGWPELKNDVEAHLIQGRVVSSICLRAVSILHKAVM